MKRLTSFLAALFLTVTALWAYDTIAYTFTQKGEQLSTGYSGTAINRGGFALMGDGIYFANNATGKMGKMDLDLTTMGETDSIGKGYYMDVDDGGNIIIYEWTQGSPTWDIAQVYDKDYKFIRKDSLKLNGRCDMPRSVGNMVSGRGAYIAACNNVSSVLRFNYVDGVLTTTDTVIVPRINRGNNSSDGLDVNHIVVQSRGNGLYWIDFTDAAPVVTDMVYFSTANFTSTYGGRVFRLAGHTLYIMGTYKVGGYLGSFAIYDITDPDNVSVIAEETSTMGDNAMGTACVTFDVKVDGDVATIYEYACFAVRKYELTATPVRTQKIKYELNGGITNDYGWQNKGDMFAAFMTDAGVTDFETLDYYMQQTDPLSFPNICHKLSDASPAIRMTEKWGWLETYLMQAHADQADDGASELAIGGAGAAWRYAVGAFFISGQRAEWPQSANFVLLGRNDAYIPTWKHAYANPTEPEDSIVLNAPYKEGHTFVGWYDTADFSGERITFVNNKTTGTLYAKWIDYVPNIAEIKALADNTDTTVQGIVNYIEENNVYIQDHTGGIRIRTSIVPDCQVGQKIIAKGTKAAYNGISEMKDADVLFAEDAKLYEPVQVKTLNDLQKHSLTYLGQCVSIGGVTIAKYDHNFPVITDGSGMVLCRMSLDETEFPVGTRVIITAVADYYSGELLLIGDMGGIKKAATVKQDTYDYPARGEKSEYTLENNWIVTAFENNFEGRTPGPANYVRGMAAKDGNMYFINRATASITVVDGATGEIFNPIAIKGEHLFEIQNEEGIWQTACTLPYNDIRFDNAGNCLMGGMAYGSETFFIYKVDLTTGEATELIKERLYDNPNFIDNGYRLDAFGVYGDVNNTAIIMAVDANSFNAYKWAVTDGKAGKAEQITCTIQPDTDQSLLVTNGRLSETNFGTAPQVHPVSTYLFYVDGAGTLPMLFDMTGALQDDFIKCPTGLQVVNNISDTCTMNTGHNGVVEFQVGDDYFLLTAATHRGGKPASAFALYKFADKDMEFAGLEPLWFFPANGMGTATNGCRTAVPSVEVKGNVATLYLYTVNNGYASYTLTNKAIKVPTAIENDTTEYIPSPRKVFRNGQVYILRGGKTYTLTGEEIQ